MAVVAFGADERTPLTDAVLAELTQRGFETVVYGPPGGRTEQWAEVGERVARDVVEGRATTGIACCFTGTGVSMAANKVAGARAALCLDAEVARGARRWNDANVLCLSLQKTPADAIHEILDAWFAAGEIDAGERANIVRLAVLDRRRDI